ncbi:FAD-dependent monooxygenase [Kribbella jejuensis]|uniref:2-polyprenyl-6-methoxyphenol hydroxylase-like FAD-dependent oxidoreductase n=1 Tax=Kribbella jejuensis TaxID=236068 RepID=A0A542ET41_9ACTN|nr:FAD-dependent oxidoreductase [Kribbella jejuensis]TQJ18533.1 2-polyprenyl-6-methoxyphenol hydroxylase-like FAD-dependent oxidoreductase [Kribbella jejuensis]
MGTAIVVGAGIGGVSAAVALQRRGWQVTVLERAPELGEVGAGISVWPSAVAVLEELGVKGVEKSSVQSQPAGMRRPDGRWVVSAPQLGMELPVMIHRAQLHDLITAEFKNIRHTKPFGMGQVTVRTGYDVREVVQDDDGVTVNGELRADLLVAADGIRSAVRSTLYPQYAGPRYSGFTAYRGIADIDLDDGGGETWGRGQLFGFARLIDGRFYWYGTANQPAGTTSEPTVFESWHDPIPRLIANTEKILQNDILDLTTPLMPFAQGRIVLLGDAAHAMTPNLGRGACSAIEDAGALGRILAGTDDLHAALAAYDAERRPATTKLVKRSRSVGRVAQTENPVLCTLRDGAFALGGKLLKLRQR